MASFSYSIKQGRQSTIPNHSMLIPLKILNALRYGRAIAAEVPATAPSLRAFVMVIPQVPSFHDNPQAWQHADITLVDFGPMVLRDSAFISGYEIRYLAHDAKYTDIDWGWDYDYVLEDESTRVRRTFVQREDEIEAALSPWLKDMEQFRPPQVFDSSLVNSPIDSYLNRPQHFPHLWR